MEEKRTGGGKEFVFSVIWTILLLFIGKIVTASLPTMKVLGVILTILMFCVLGFFALTRYAAIYTYSLKNDRLRINRKIGHRNKEIEISASQVRAISKNKPPHNVKRIRNMRTAVFSKRDAWYLVYEKDNELNMLVFEPSKKMADKIKSRAKGKGKKQAQKSERN